MRKINKIILLIFIIILPLTAWAKSYSIRVKMNGLIFAIDGFIIFQPVDSITGFKINVINEKSFKLGTFENPELPTAFLSGIGDTIWLDVKNNISNNVSKKKCSYFFCEVGMDIWLMDTIDKPHSISPPKFILYSDTNQYSCYGYFVNNRIISVEPSKISVQNKLKNIYKRNGMPLPAFLSRKSFTQTTDR